MNPTKQTTKTKEEWLEVRRNHIGASEVAAILGADPYRGPLAIYEAKTTGHSIEDNKWMKYGRDVESAIANMYAEETGREIADLGATEIQYHNDYPWIGATLDRQIVTAKDAPADGPGPLELKSKGKGYAPAYQDEPDLKDIIQNQIQMFCTGAEWGSLAALFPGYQLAVHDHLLNMEFIDAALPILNEFWERVIHKDPPPPDQTPGCLEVVKRLYPIAEDKTIELDHKVADLVIQWELAKSTASLAGKEAKDLEAQIRAEMRDATFGQLPDGNLLSLKVTKRKGYTKVFEPVEFRTLRKVKGK